MSRSSIESLDPFFRPRTVAVVGASRAPDGVGRRVLEALREGGFTGRIIPVNPHASEIAGLKAFPAVTAIPEPIDLAVIAVPSDRVLSIIDDCGAKQVSAAVLITAGFAETGGSGLSLERNLLERIRRYGMRLIGPNCFGLMNLDPAVRLNATYTPMIPPLGRVAVASESGGLGLGVVTAAARLNLGLSGFVSLGNHLDVTVNDLLEYWERDEATEVVLLYLETIVEPEKFRRIAERICRRKPVIVLKGGRTPAGQTAAGSHTAALATNDPAVDALFAQCGVIRAATLDHLLGLAAAVSNQPRPRGPRIGILTNSGGPGVLSADSCAAEGLTVPELSPATRARLASFLPRTAALKNPVDVIGFAAEWQHARSVETLLTSEDIDALIVVHVSVRPEDNPPVAAGIIEGVRAARKTGVEKPVYLCWMAEGDLDRTFTVDGEAIPTFGRPETPATLIRDILAQEAWRQRPQAGAKPLSPPPDLTKAQAVCDRALSARGAGWLSAEETGDLLTAMGLPLVRGQVATTADEAARAAREIGFPIAVKLASHLLVHKTEIDAVHLNLKNEEEVRAAYQAIRARLLQDHRLEAMEGVLVQSMLSSGVEVAVGMNRDPLFGPLIAFGLGGIHIEVLGDVQFRLAPLTVHDAVEMVEGIKGVRLLGGYRGAPAVDVDAIKDALLRVSHLAVSIPEISELDLNPIFALPDAQGCRIVDARIAVCMPQAPFSKGTPSNSSRR